MDAKTTRKCDNKLWSKVTISFFACMLAMVAAIAIPATAHASVFGYTILNQNVTTYTNASCTQKSGCTYPSDQLTFLSIGNSSCKVRYATSKGNKDAYVPTKMVIQDACTSGPVKYAKKVVTTYKRPGGQTYGYLGVNDRVVVLRHSASGYWQVYYPAGSNFKLGWITDSGYNQAFGSSTSTSTNTTSATAKVQSHLNKIALGQVRYNSSTVTKVGSKFTGTRSNEQCKGYAKNLFYMCFKVTPGSTLAKPQNYLISSTKGMTRVGYYSSITASKAKSLFSKGRPGDFIQMRRAHGGSHSAIVYSVSSTGMTVLEANTDGRNTIMKNTYTWAQLAQKNAGMSLYTATSYSLK